MTQIASFIRTRRRELSLTQADVARSCGLASCDFIGLVESDRRRLQLERIPRLAEVLEVEPRFLCQLALCSWSPRFAAALELPAEDHHEAAA